LRLSAESLRASFIFYSAAAATIVLEGGGRLKMNSSTGIDRAVEMV
jgi:hypothetical protein